MNCPYCLKEYPDYLVLKHCKQGISMNLFYIDCSCGKRFETLTHYTIYERKLS